MAAALDFDLGSASPASGANTAVLTTSHAASPGTRIVVLFSYFLGTGTASLAGGGLTWHQDKHIANGSDQFDIWSAPAPAGLATSTALTFTGSGGNTFGGVLIGAVSISGVDMTQNGGVDVTGSGTTTGTNWSSGAASAVLGGISLGGAGAEAASTTETATASTGTLLHHLYHAADGQGFATAWQVVAPGAAGAVAGTFANSSTATTGALVIYTGTGGVAPSPHVQPFLPLMAPQGM